MLWVLDPRVVFIDEVRQHQGVDRVQLIIQAQRKVVADAKSAGATTYAPYAVEPVAHNTD